jgi:CRISPR-associated protein Csm3
MERVPAGVSFDFSFSLKEMGDDDLAENLNLIWKGMRLIELDGLGGSISRGSGQVEFQDVLLNGKPTDFREIPLWE